MASWPGCGCGAGQCPSSEAGRMKGGLAVHLNDLPEPQARAVLEKCCGAPRWVERMLAARPRIGERPPEEWSDREQAGMRSAPQATRRALEVGNRAYEERFGYLFLICASGRSAAEMLGELRRRR